MSCHPGGTPAARLVGMRTCTRVGLAFAAAVGVLCLSMAPASAHYPTAFHGEDGAMVSHRSQHSYLTVQDKECDGHSVFGEYEDADGLGGAVRDPNGCKVGLGKFEARQTIVRFRVCEASVGCSAWVYI